MAKEAKELTRAAANYRKSVFEPGNYCFDSKVEIKRIEDAFAAGAKWFEEQLNSITKVEPKQKREKIHFCESCIHFKQKGELEEFEELDDFSELCQLGKVLKFKMPPENDYMSYDYGFYCLGCRDYKET